MLEVPVKLAVELLSQIRTFLSTFGLDKDIDTKHYTIDILADVSRLHRPDATGSKKKKYACSCRFSSLT